MKSITRSSVLKSPKGLNGVLVRDVYSREVQQLVCEVRQDISDLENYLESSDQCIQGQSIVRILVILVAMLVTGSLVTTTSLPGRRSDLANQLEKNSSVVHISDTSDRRVNVNISHLPTRYDLERLMLLDSNE